MAGIPSFIFGAGTKYKTQEELDRAREQVKALLEDTTQYTGWGGFLENLGEGIGAGLEQRRINEGQEGLTAAQAPFSQTLAEIAGGYGGGGGAVGDIVATSGADTLTGKGNGDMGAYQNAIAGIESGGRYDAVGPRHPKLGRALGKYQVMEANIGPWSRKYLGREVSPQEFLASPEIQDAVFNGEFGTYVSKYGPEGAARAWIGGPGGVSKPGRRDSLGTSVGDYGRRFTNSLTGGGGGSNAQAGGGKDDSFLQAKPNPDRFAPEIQPAPPAPAPVPVPAPVPPPQQQVPQPFDLANRRRITPDMVPDMFQLNPSTAPGRLSDEYVQPNAAPAPAPAPVPTPRPTPPPVAKVDPFTDMILGDKASQFKPGNYIPPAPVGKQVFPAAPPAPGTPGAVGFGVPPVVGGGGPDQLVGKGTFPPAPASPQAQQAGGITKIGKLMTILASPYASDEQKRMATAMLSREYDMQDAAAAAAAEKADPKYKLGLRKLEAEVAALENPNSGFRRPTDAEMKEYNLDPSKSWKVNSKTGEVSQIGGGGVTVQVGDEGKLPTNYRYIDPNDPMKGVEPIPGGPAEQMPAELAARIGLARDALKILPDLEKTITAGGATGIGNWTMGSLGRGEQGTLYREMAAGSEALVRMLTGAGMNAEEAKKEAYLYLPQLQDDAKSLTSKVQQLQRRLIATVEQAEKGRVSTKEKPAEGEWTVMPNGVKVRAK